MEFDIDRAKRLAEILKTEYGITTEQQLDEAIKKQKKLDISVFCAPLEKKATGRKNGRKAKEFSNA